MPTQITDYKCPACTAPLRFDSNTERLKCDYCGGSYTTARIEALYAEKEKAAEAAFSREEKKARKKPPASEEEDQGGDWDLSALSGDWGEDAQGMRAYSCPSCGAELITDQTTAATSCPYCGNNTIIPGQFDGTLRPDYIIPFRLDKEAAKQALKNHYRKKIFLPRAFSSANHLEELKGVYVPFWLFDAEAEAYCNYHATRSSSYREGDYRVTVTKHYQVHRAGTMQFSHVPADASTKMPDDYMDSIEPFDYQGLKPFSTAYLPGYLADKYDVTAQESAGRANKRCQASAIEVMRRDVVGYETVSTENASVHLRRGKVHYALMPVWTLRTRWEGKDYLFMMNGQTGKMVGDLPMSKAKSLAIFGGLSVLFSALSLWAGVGQWLAALFMG